uniref:Basement membrane-specific heparan sulfate proteoglycan core protein n=1 Tax=Echeneis naucrates TaxID=173247 RepID=A0A665URZ3_ECHNA
KNLERKSATSSYLAVICGPEMSCKLVEHVPGQPVRNPQCRICNHRSTNPFERHPIEYAIDGTNRWWQSPSIKNGMEYHYVTITLDLKQVFQIAYVIVKAANSPRPGNWILERSIDGVTFDPWQYYAMTDTECLTRFNINPRRGPPSYTRDDEVICTSFYSKIHPLENGEIHASLINGRPSADDPSPALLNFTSARYIRLVFQRIRTLNADLMTLTLREHKDIDPIVTRRYYYSIKDISVGGMCICYGHAKACPLNALTKRFSCECEHNTCGESCDRCCPGYHQQPWMAGTFLTRHICEKCNCHGKAEECYFNQTVADLSLSLDIHGKYRGGGVCVDCRANTAGINCQTCVPGYYRPAEVSAEEETPCIPCSCDLRGSVSQVCVADSSLASPSTSQPAGSCRCKEGFGGLRCDRCAVGYMGFPSCQRCNCSVEGSTNDDPCITPCMCKENVEGENCDRCKLGFYNLRRDNRRGCEKCSCMGLSSQCSASTWTYQNVGTLLCHLCVFQACLPGFRRVNGHLYNGVCEACHCHGHSSRCDEFSGHCLDCFHHTTGPHCDTCLPGYYGRATQGSPADCQPCACPLNLPSNNFSPTCHLGEGGELLCDQCPSGHTGPRCDRCSNGYYGKPTVPGGSCRPCDCHGNLDLAVPGSCDPITGQCLRCRQGYGGASCDSCADGYYGDAVTAKNCQPCQCHTNGSVYEVCHKDTGQCQCKTNVAGRKCDECMPHTHGITTRGQCVPCHCNSFGSKSFDCDETGQCRCQPGVTGPKCDRCSRGFFNFQEGGCTPCQCSHVGENCDANTGQCICPPNTIGERCDRCAPNHWGHDIVTGCKECGCSPIGSVSQQCNVNTGCCLCLDSFRGEKCNECQLGYRDFPQCTQCECNVSGSDSQTCDLERGVCACADRTGKCSCKVNVEGHNCDRCKPNTFGLSVRNPLGCSNCYCYGLTQSCTEAQGLIRMWVSKHLFIFRLCWVPLMFDKNSHLYWISATLRPLADAIYPCLYFPLWASVFLHVSPPLSVQECAAGFYRLRSGSLASAPASRVPIAAGMGSCVRCQCSGHSSTCDPETSICQNCQDNTEGDRCERCAPGFYGVVRGFPDDCKPCACPLPSPNNFSPTCVAEGFEDYRCTACPEGYEGKYCERCATGYHGNPRMPGGRCEECKCSLWGALPGPCDPVTGQCRCRDGASGRSCEQCMERHVSLQRAGHEMSCDDECSGLLISDMDRLYRIITDVTVTTPLPPPYKMLYRFENMTDELKVKSLCLAGFKGRFDLCFSIFFFFNLIYYYYIYIFFFLSFPTPRSILAEARNLSFNATAAFKAYSNIKANVDSAEKEAKAAKQRANEALALVRGHTLISMNSSAAIICHPLCTLYALSRLKCAVLCRAALCHSCALSLSLLSVHAAGAKVKDLEDEADRLLEKLQPIKKLQDNLKRNISQIKELINQARKQANSIKVSVSSGGDCLRSYRPDIRKGRYNTIILHVKTTTPDNLLLYLGSAKYVDFLALEMRKGKVNFLWDVGSGVGRVEYPHHTIHDGNWHRIEANGLNGTVSVYPLEGSMAGMMPTPASANSPTAYTILDVDQNAYLFVGGLLGTVKKADAVKTTTFTGCMGETFLDGKPIGLWNYRDRQGDCKGCSVSALVGFSIFLVSELLLFLGPMNLILFKSSQRIFPGTCKTEDNGQMIRYLDLATSQGSADLLDVVGMLYVGGLPLNYTTKRIGPVRNTHTHTHTHTPFYFELDMTAPTSSHMVGTCFVDTETGTYFDGTGYLKAVSSYRVGLDVSIELEFRTSRTNGVLLAVSNQANDGLGLEIVQGKLFFHVDNGAGRITAEHVPEGEGFCDGQWHAVTANKLRHRVELVVDGKQSQAESPNTRSNTCDTNDPIYVGGYPSGVRQAALSTSASFRGCMKNLKITKAAKIMAVQFNKALEIKGVQPLSCPAAAA